MFRFSCLPLLLLLDAFKDVHSYIQLQVCQALASALACDFLCPSYVYARARKYKHETHKKVSVCAPNCMYTHLLCSIREPGQHLLCILAAWFVGLSLQCGLAYIGPEHLSKVHARRSACSALTCKLDSPQAKGAEHWCDGWAPVQVSTLNRLARPLSSGGDADGSRQSRRLHRTEHSQERREQEHMDQDECVQLVRIRMSAYSW